MAKNNSTEAERSLRSETRKAEFLAKGEICNAVFWPTLGFLRERTFHSSGFSAEGTSVTVSAVTKRLE